jgi:hypothetical protein
MNGIDWFPPSWQASPLREQDADTGLLTAEATLLDAHGNVVECVHGSVDHVAGQVEKFVSCMAADGLPCAVWVVPDVARAGASAALPAGSGRVLAPEGACSIAFDGELSDRLGEVLDGMIGYWFDVTLRDGTVFGAILRAVERDEHDRQQKATFARSVQLDDALDPAAGAVVQTFDLYEDVAVLRPI